MQSESSNKVDRLRFDLQRHIAESAQPFLIAIDGRSGVGKSTLATSLAKHFDALMLAGDDFFSGGVTLRSEPPSILVEDCINWRRLKEVLRALRTQGKAHFLPFDWEAFDGSRCNDPTVLTARSVMILEGVYSARPELREFVDFAVLIDIPEDIRIRRLVEREGRMNAWENQWHRAENWYFEKIVKLEDFDVVLTEEDLPEW